MSWQIKYRLKLDFHLVFYRELRAMKISRCYHEEAVDATGAKVIQAYLSRILCILRLLCFVPQSDKIA